MQARCLSPRRRGADLGRVWIYLTLVLHTGVGQVWGGLTQDDAESVHAFVMLRQVANRFGQV